MNDKGGGERQRLKFLPTASALFSNVHSRATVHVNTILLKARGEESKKKSKKKGKGEKPGGSAGNAAYVRRLPIARLPNPRKEGRADR